MWHHCGWIWITSRYIGLYVCTYERTYTHLCTYMCTYMYTFMYTCMCTYMHSWLCVLECLHMIPSSHLQHRILGTERRSHLWRVSLLLCTLYWIDSQPNLSSLLYHSLHPFHFSLLLLLYLLSLLLPFLSVCSLYHYTLLQVPHVVYLVLISSHWQHRSQDPGRLGGCLSLRQYPCKKNLINMIKMLMPVFCVYNVT